MNWSNSKTHLIITLILSVYLIGDYSTATKLFAFNSSKKKFQEFYQQAIRANSVTPLKEYKLKNPKSKLIDLADSLINLKTNIDRFNLSIKSFENKTSFDEQDLISLEGLNKSLSMYKQEVLDIRRRLNSLNIKISLRSYFEDHFYELKGDYLENYYICLEHSLKNFSNIELAEVNEGYSELLKNLSTENLKLFLDLVTQKMEEFSNYKKELRKEYSLKFITSFFEHEAEEKIKSLNRLKANAFNHFAEVQIKNNDFYNGIINLEISYNISKSPSTKSRIIGIIDELESNKKLSMFTSSLELQNIFTGRLTKRIDLKIYTYGKENPIILKTSVKLYNYSDEIANLLAYAPDFNYTRTSPDNFSESEIQIIYLIALEKQEAKFEDKYLVYPGTSSESSFYYLLNFNAISGENMLELYKLLFTRIVERIKSGKYSNYYTEGKAKCSISLDQITFEFDNLLKVY